MSGSSPLISGRCSCTWEADESGNVIRCQTCPVCCTKAGYRIADCMSQMSLFEGPDLRSKSGPVSVSAVIDSFVVNGAHEDSDPKDSLPF